MSSRDMSKESTTDNGSQDEEVVPVPTKRRIMRGKPEVFDKIAFNVLSYLETFDEVGDIEFAGPEGSATACNLWDSKHAPHTLPYDVKGFASLFNGVSLKWCVDMGATSVPVGEININKVDAMVEVELSGQFMKPSDDGRDSKMALPDPLNTVGYEIAKVSDGIVAMLFTVKTAQEKEKPCEIWFKDEPSSTWHYICDTFTQYVRLCILHLGIYGWQKIFTPEGISITSRQWMGMFCRERLCVYQHHHHNASKSKR